MSVNGTSMEYQQSVNGASTMFDLASLIIKRQWNTVNPQWIYWQPLLAKMLVMILRIPPTIKRPWSISNLCRGSVRYTAWNCIVLLLSWVLCGQSFQSVLLYNFTNMHPLSHRSDFFACSLSINIQEPAVCITLMLLSAVSWVRLPSILISNPM